MTRWLLLVCLFAQDGGEVPTGRPVNSMGHIDPIWKGTTVKETPMCPHCDSTLKPERIGAGRYICDCCARIFIVPKGT